MSYPPPPPPEETAVGGRTPKVNMTPHLQKKKGTASAAGILDVDMSLLCPSLTSVGSSAPATAAATAAAAAAAAGTASPAPTATTASTSASSTPSSPSSSTAAIFTKSFQTSTEVINRFSTLTFSSASFKVRNGSSSSFSVGGGPTTSKTTTAATHVSNKRWNAYHTPELEQLVKSISSTLTDTDATYGSSTATVCNHKIMDVTFEPRGCKWDAMVVPVTNDGSDYSRDTAADEAPKSVGGVGRRSNSANSSSSSSIFRLPPPFHIQLVCSAVCEKNTGGGGGGSGEVAQPLTKPTTAPGGTSGADDDEAKNEASSTISSSRDSTDASATASGSGGATNKENKEEGGGGGEEGQEDTHADDEDKEQAEQKTIASGVSKLHLNNNKSSPHQHFFHRGPIRYVIDYKVLPDTTTNDNDDDDDDIDEAETDRHTVIKKIFDEIGFDIKKAVVRCEFPEFPQGCKGVVFRDVYQLNARLKSGSFATVCRGTHRETKKKVAIKCVLRKDLPPSDDAAIFDEVAILASLKHRYVVQLIDFFVEKECYFIVMELMAGGDLFDRIGKKKTYTERDARDLCRKMLEAMAYCHSKNIAHCDMKPKNLLLKSEEDDSFIKLADFGFAARVYTPKSLSKQCGTPFFVAPEILMRSPYDQASDMWSVGCIVYLLLCGNLPFMGRTQRELFRKIVVGKFEFPEEEWSHISDDAKDLVSRLLVTDPDKRMTAADALRSKWIRQNAMRLQRNSLLQTSQRLKTFNARMKLRSAMIAVDWVSTMSRSMSWTRSSKSLGREGSGNSTGFASILSQASNEDAANELPSPPGPQRQASIKEEEAAPPAKKGNLAALIRDAASNDAEAKSPPSAGHHRQVSIKKEKAAPSGKKGNLAAMIAREKDAAN